MTADGLSARIARLGAEVQRLRAAGRAFAPERLAGAHNPWGPASGLIDAWAILDVCEEPTLLDGVERRIGPDIVLWDGELCLDAARYRDFLRAGREGRYWPVEPLTGTITVVSLATVPVVRTVALDEIGVEVLDGIADGAPLLVIRHMPATSRFIRDPRHPANRRGAEEHPLINLATRPLWQARGVDRANNDFVTGFAATAPRWAGSAEWEN